MFIQTAFSFSNAVQRWVCRFSGLRLVALRWFVVFLASGPCVASASSYFFGSSRDPGKVEVDRQGAGKLVVAKHTTT
ncbi:DUF1010 domain-containing protein, partial [Aeromonas caviae]|uniref:DUF1010 domain-containing protein n=1 Tax=Aeromonas caviae TaxID=648 RepID=UPI002E1131FB